VGPSKGHFDHRNNTLGPNKTFQPPTRSILKYGNKICQTFPAGTHTKYYEDNAPTPPPACGVSCSVSRGPSIPSVHSGHRANLHTCKLSSGECCVSHRPGTPCCARQNEWKRTLSAPGGSLSPARSPQPCPHTAVASHCSTHMGHGEAGRALQGSLTPVAKGVVSGSKVVFHPVIEVFSPNGDSKYRNTAVSNTAGHTCHPERTRRVLWKNSNPTELMN